MPAWALLGLVSLGEKHFYTNAVSVSFNAGCLLANLIKDYCNPRPINFMWHGNAKFTGTLRWYFKPLHGLLLERISRYLLEMLANSFGRSALVSDRE